MQTGAGRPEGTARARSLVTGATPRGTFAGEILNSFLQYKSFALSSRHSSSTRSSARSACPARAARPMPAARRLADAGRRRRLQLKQIVNGKDPQPMDDPRFWLQALQTGGGFGLMGDFLFAVQNRLGQSLGEQLAGPTVAAASDALKLTVGNAQALVRARGSAPRRGRGPNGVALHAGPVEPVAAAGCLSPGLPRPASISRRSGGREGVPRAGKPAAP